MSMLAVILCIACSVIGGIAGGGIGAIIVLDSMARHAPGHARAHEYRATTTKPS